MFRQFARLPLRRYAHTSAARAVAIPRQVGWSRAQLAFGASAVTATYLTWRATTQPVLLDADTTQHPLSAESASKPEALAAAAVDHSDAPAGPDAPARKLKPKAKVAPESSSEPSSANNSEFIPESSEEGGEATPATTEGEGEGEEGHGASGGAYDPVTGEINWDCPCLGGMAHGPCGPEFREAFSCFIYSEGEPKGIECVEKFKGMQDCFRRHPEVYAEEIMDDDDDAPAPASASGEEQPEAGLTLASAATTESPAQAA